MKLERVYVLALLLVLLASVYRQHRAEALAAAVRLCQGTARTFGQLAIAAEDAIREGVTA